MTRSIYPLPIRHLTACFVIAAACASLSRAQSANAPTQKPSAGPVALAASAPDAKATPVPDRSQAYYHLGLASYYEQEAMEQGRPEYVTFAIEEYKKALATDVTSPQLNLSLAELYFREGKPHEAEVTVRELLKSVPENLDAHKLLGRIYLRQLSEGQNAGSPALQANSALDKAIEEYEHLAVLDPRNVEQRLVLGQLYTVKHDQKKAEEQFKLAKAMDPDSEDVVLSLARLYAQSGDIANSVKAIEAVPATDRTAKMEFALGAAYEQLKQPKQAIEAYRQAANLEPSDLRTLDSLAQALLNDKQLDEALKAYQELSASDPENAETLVHISEIERRQGKYEPALEDIRKAQKAGGDHLETSIKLEIGYNEGLLLDVLGRMDEAAEVYERMVELTSHANGAYTAEEKNNRSIFLERLGALLEEQNKTDQAVAAFQKMVDLGGEHAINGYRGQIAAYSEAHQYDKAIDRARQAIEANPKDKDLKLILAEELAGLGKLDEGLNLARGLLANTAEDRGVWMEIGQINVRARRWKEAEEAFIKADPLTTKKEDRVYLLFARGELAERQKKLESAEQFFRQALELDPDNSLTLNYLGYTLADKGVRLPEALKFIRRAVELDPMNGAYLDSLGWIYFKMGQYELAEENLRRAVERTRTDPTVHDHLGELYEKTGRIRLAVAQWELSAAEFTRQAPAEQDPAEQAKVQKKLDGAKAKLAKQESASRGVKVQ